MSNIVMIVLEAVILLVALLTFLSSVTSWFRLRIPLAFGFLFDDKISRSLEVATGDPAKPILLRFRNLSKATLTGVVIELRFYRPLALSSSEQALTDIEGRTIHGRIPGNAYYLIRYFDLEIPGDEKMDFTIVLNTEDKSPGKYRIAATVYSNRKDYKYKTSELSLLMK